LPKFLQNNQKICIYYHYLYYANSFSNYNKKFFIYNKKCLKKKNSTNIIYKAYIPEEDKQKHDNGKEKKKYKNQKQIMQKILQTQQNPRKVILPWYLKYFFLLLWCFIILFVVKYIFAVNGMSAQLVKKWWNDNNGKSYQPVFSIDLFLLYTNFSLGYEVKSLFTSEILKFENRAQAEFMVQLIYGYGKFDDTDPIRTLVPKNLFESIIPENYILDPFDDDGKATLRGVDSGTMYDEKTGWPVGSKAVAAWQQILKNWGAKTDDNGKWTKNKYNFLSNVYIFNVNAPVIRCFLKQDDDTCLYDKVNNQALGILLGIEGAGLKIIQCGNNCGWWGFLRNGFKGTDITISDVASAIYNDKVIPNPAGPCTSWGQAATSALFTGLSSGVSIFAFTAKFTGTAATAAETAAAAGSWYIGPIAGIALFGVDLLSTKYGSDSNC
jgi:hypothetical protein